MKTSNTNKLRLSFRVVLSAFELCHILSSHTIPSVDQTHLVVEEIDLSLTNQTCSRTQIGRSRRLASQEIIDYDRRK